MSKKILIVDDSLFMRTILKDILPDKYEIVEADSGHKAMKQFVKEVPDLTLLDIIMPEGELEGISVLKGIKEINSKANVVMITAVGQDAILQECKELGVKDYIVKPFNKEVIVETVAKYTD